MLINVYLIFGIIIKIRVNICGPVNFKNNSKIKENFNHIYLL